MNILDAVVTKVIGSPREEFYKWWVKVEYDCYGVLSETDVMLETKEEAESVKVGYKFYV